MNTTISRVAFIASSTCTCLGLLADRLGPAGPWSTSGSPRLARSAGYRAPGAGANMSPGPSMSRPGGAGPGVQRPGAGGQGGIQRPNAGSPGRPFSPRMWGNPVESSHRTRRAPAASNGPTWGRHRFSGREPGGMQRPNAGPGGIQRPDVGSTGPVQRPNAGAPGGIQRPNAVPFSGRMPGINPVVSRDRMQVQCNGRMPGSTGWYPAAEPRRLQWTSAAWRRGPRRNHVRRTPGLPRRRRASSSGPGNRLPQGIQRPEAGGPSDIQRPRPALREEFLTNGREPAAAVTTSATRPMSEQATAPISVSGNRTNVGVGGNTTNVNVGNVNVGNQVSYTNNNQAWVNQRQTWGNNVRTDVGGRYNNVFNSSYYRGGFVTGGYNYYGGWAARGPYYAWSPVTWAAIGGFFGGAWATAQPVYYAYGQGGNVYYENNVVYVNGQAAGTPQEYYQQTQALAAAAPPVDQVNAQQQDWLPLGVFALTSEDTGDSQTVLQLAVNKQGMIAGTYYNEANQVSRPIQGTADVKTQRAVMTFADNKNTDRILETGINNLTQDEAPALLALRRTTSLNRFCSSDSNKPRGPPRHQGPHLQRSRTHVASIIVALPSTHRRLTRSAPPTVWRREFKSGARVSVTGVPDEKASCFVRSRAFLQNPCRIRVTFVRLFVIKRV